MATFKLEPDAEVSGVFSSGETWLVKFNANGTASVKDEQIQATLAALAADPDNPVKGK